MAFVSEVNHIMKFVLLENYKPDPITSTVDSTFLSKKFTPSTSDTSPILLESIPLLILLMVVIVELSVLLDYTPYFAQLM